MNDGLYDRLEAYGQHVVVDAFYPAWNPLAADSPVRAGEAGDLDVHPAAASVTFDRDEIVLTLTLVDGFVL